MVKIPKPVRKIVKAEKKHMLKAINNPKHGLSKKSKKEHLSSMVRESKARHTNMSTKMAKFRKKHPGEAYEE